jgi:amino acid adenylation domain-containing protein
VKFEKFMSLKPCDPFIPFSTWTTSQRELWSLQTLEINGAALNTGEYTELVGHLDMDAFVRASRQTVEECEALRTRFGEEDGQPVQWIAPIGEWSPIILDFSHDKDPSKSASEWMAAELARTFDIAEEMFSWTLIKIAEARHLWCLIAHQLAVDGFSRNLAARRMADHYSRLIDMVEGKTSLPHPLSGLLREDAEYRQSEGFENGRVYWLRQMAGLHAPVRLTSRASRGSYVPVRYTSPVPASAFTSIRKIMADTGISLSGLFVCLAALYLRRLTEASDIVVGLLVAARTTPVMANTPGNVSNTVPLRLKIDSDTTLADLIAEARVRIREALTHQRVPLSEIKAALPGLNGELYAIAVNVMRFDFALNFTGLVTTTHNLSNGPVDDVSISVFEQPSDGSLRIALNGNASRYEPTQLAAHYSWFMSCLEQICRTNPSTRVDDINWISEADRSMLLACPDIGEAPDAKEPANISSGDEPMSAREAQICRAFALALGVAGFPPRANFFKQGGYSLLAARLISSLSKQLDVKIPLRALFDHPTPRALTLYLSGHSPRAVHKGGSPLLVLCPGGGLLMRELLDLSNALERDFRVLLVEYPDWRHEWQVICDIDRYFDFILAQIRAAAPEPCRLNLVGYSFGSDVAYAMCVVLTRLGYTIERLHIIDSPSPIMKKPASAKRPKLSRFKKLLLRDKRAHQRALGRLIGIEAKKPLLKAILRCVRPIIPDAGKNEFLLYMSFNINASIPMRGIREWTAAIAADARRVVAPSTLFRSMDSADNWPYDFGWTELAPNLEIVSLPGSHLTIFNDHNIEAICSRIGPGRKKSAMAIAEPRVNVLAPSPVCPHAILRGRAMPELLRNELLSEMFEATVALAPNSTCLTTLDSCLTYADVDARATAIARGLVRYGAKAGEVVGLWLERGADVLISQIAIAKTGAAWLAFDSDAPVERVAACLKNACACLLLADAERVKRSVGGLRCPAVDPLAIIDDSDQSDVGARATGATPDHAAYIIYTSGSTGEPKGIAVSNRNICHFVRAMNEVYGITADDVMFQNATVAFDLSMEQTWLPYMVGASLFVADAETAYEIDELPGRLERAGVTILDTLPTMLAMFPRDVETLRIIILGGEACSPAVVERWARDGRAFYNTYGPTETTVVATASELRKGEAVTIGSPIPNYSCYVVDANLGLVGAGVEGELLIGGPGVAKGYVGPDDLTARKFIDNPFESNACDPILYRTGDAVEIDAQGNLIFKGRIDDQVKIRGFRVELDEIDARLSDIPGVSIAATVLLNEHGEDRLKAYLVTATEVDEQQLRETLQKHLPGYMVPMRFERVDALPRLPSGKVDRKAMYQFAKQALAAARGAEQQTSAHQLVKVQQNKKYRSR